MTITFEQTQKNLITRFTNDGCVDAGHLSDCAGWFLRFVKGRAQLDHRIPTDVALRWGNGEELTPQEQQGLDAFLENLYRKALVIDLAGID